MAESDLDHQGDTGGKVVIKERIADAMFQQILLRPDEYDVLATPNLNGDYMSDALATQVGYLGMAPGANLGENIAVFEATPGPHDAHTPLPWSTIPGLETTEKHQTTICGLAWHLTHKVRLSCFLPIEREFLSVLSVSPYQFKFVD